MEPSPGHSRPNEEAADSAATKNPITATPVAGAGGETEPELTPREEAVVDARQDELMAIESADGRPPSHRVRMAEWRWAAIGLPLLVLGAVAWAVVRGVSVGAIIGFGVVFLLILILGGWPVLAAGLLRGKEESVARKEALAELPP